MKRRMLRRIVSFVLLFILIAMSYTAIAVQPTSFSSSHYKISEKETHSQLSDSPGRDLGIRLRGMLPAVTSVSGNSSSNNVTYDEQLGTSFTGNYTFLRYNIRATEQEDINGFGPAYLVNGLTSENYWYQVGLSWNWPNSGTTFNPGFGFNFEVWNPTDNSIFPTNGGGGLENFSGPINPGDILVVSLSIVGSSVIMSAVDTNTTSSASVNFAAHGISFVGTPNAPASPQGYFTGLMTEKYSVVPYSGDFQKVPYLSNGTIVSSAWMWIDEFDAITNQSVFARSTNQPLALEGSPQLQIFTGNGATLATNSTLFVSGNAGSVVFNLSYTNVGGNSSAPILTYLSGGDRHNATLSTKTNAFDLDYGSLWNITTFLPSNSSTDRWLTRGGELSGVAILSVTSSFEFYHQYQVPFSYSVNGSGLGYVPPSLNYTSAGSLSNATLTTDQRLLWVDSGTSWIATLSLGGSNSSTRWKASTATGIVSSPEPVRLSYRQQYYVVFDTSESNGGSSGIPTGWYNGSEAVILNPSTNSGWKFENWNGSGSGSYSGNQSGKSLTIMGPITETAIFYPGLNISVTGPGTVKYAYSTIGSVVSSGQSTEFFVPPGTNVTLTAQPSAFFGLFNGWSGSKQSSSANITLEVNEPSTSAASFSYNYNLIFLPLLVVIAAIVGAVFVFLRRRKLKSPQVVQSTQDTRPN